MNKRINVVIDEQEWLLLSSLIKKYGGKAPQILRNGIKIQYDKAFPNYALNSRHKGIPVEITPKLNLTPEQICEQIIGAKVTRDNNGTRVCEFREGAMRTTVPLSKMGEGDWTPEYLNPRIRKTQKL